MSASTAAKKGGSTMSIQSNTIPASRPAFPAIPSLATFGRLFFGGYCALMAWEIWSRTITAWVVGGPLEPPQLVISLVDYWTHYPLSLATATFIHYAVGIFGYPIAYWIVSRTLKGWDFILDAGVLAIFTAFLLWRFSHVGFETGNAIFWLCVAALTLSRFVNASKRVRESLSWGSFTWFNALGIMAPLAGLPFLLIDGAALLSFMSWVGHILFGFLAALIFETLEERARTR
jgi:hypothetical protein